MHCWPSRWPQEKSYLFDVFLLYAMCRIVLNQHQRRVPDDCHACFTGAGPLSVMAVNCSHVEAGTPWCWGFSTFGCGGVTARMRCGRRSWQITTARRMPRDRPVTTFQCEETTWLAQQGCVEQFAVAHDATPSGTGPAVATWRL